MTKKPLKQKQYTKEERAKHKAQVEHRRKIRELEEKDREEEENEVPDR